MSCLKGGYPSIRHNEIRDFTAYLMTEVCHNVAVEPYLQPLSGETMVNASPINQNGARLDVAANGFWGSRFEWAFLDVRVFNPYTPKLDVAADGFWGSRFERAFLDVRVFNPYTPSNQRSSLQACYRNHENAKKRAYNHRIREVEHGTFTPLIFSCTSGMGHVAVTTYKRLAALIAAKKDEPYSATMGWIRCCFSFSFLRTVVMCLRGARSSIGHAARQFEAPIDLVSSVAHVPQLD